MLRQRMTSQDIRASVEEMRANLVGLRLINLYDIQAKTFLFRFGDSENKRTVMLENGVRMHLTSLERDKPMVPSQFTLKLRKHVRAWRLDTITQFQQDRTIDMCFGTAGTEGCFHIIVELFSKGNVILTDHAYSIMMLLRTHKDDDVSIRVHERYPVTPPLAEAIVVSRGTCEAQRGAILRADWETITARADDTATLKQMVAGVKHVGPTLAEHIAARTLQRLTAETSEAADAQSGSNRDNASVGGNAGPPQDLLRQLAPGKLNTRRKDLTVPLDAIFNAMLPAMLEVWEMSLQPVPSGGYLFKVDKTAGASAKKKGIEGNADNNGNSSTGAGEGRDTAANSETTPAAVTVGAPAAGAQVITAAERYDDFSPVVLAQHEAAERAGTLHKTFLPSFGSVCDQYFLFTETQSISKHNAKQNKAVLSKREKFERDFQRRVSTLEREQEVNQAKGELIILNADKVDEAIDLINGALAAGIQWDALKQLLRRRHAEGHAVAHLINELLLERNAMTILLERELYDDEDDADVTPMVIEIELGKTAHANAADYFQRKKANQAKLGKTLASQEKAAAGAERKGQRVAAKQDVKKQIVVSRTREWWEKFLWFITSAGDLVLQGKDIQTTEIIVRRLLRVGDVMVHCDVDGALPCFLRPLGALWAASPDTDAEAATAANIDGTHGRPPIAQVSLEEAGAYCVSRSSAYEQKNIHGSWWIYASQIIGGSASGTYLFSGEKNHLPPKPLTLGCGLLCRVARDVRTPAVPRTTHQPSSPQLSSPAADTHANGLSEKKFASNAAAAAAAMDNEDNDPAETMRYPPWPRYLRPGAAPKSSAANLAPTAAPGVGPCATIPADAAEELQELASVEALRPVNPRSAKGVSAPRTNTGTKAAARPPPAAAAVATAATAAQARPRVAPRAGGGGERGKTKAGRHDDKGSRGFSRSQLKKDRLAAQHERIALEQAFAATQAREDADGIASDTTGAGRAASEGHEEALLARAAAVRGTFDPRKPPPPPQLTKRQKKKLQMIKAKYADQDDEDRERGVTLNGNHLSKVQVRMLEEEMEREQQALAEARVAEKAQRAKDRKAGRLRYLEEADAIAAAAGGSSDDEEGEDDEIDVVDDFTDSDEESSSKTSPTPTAVNVHTHVDPESDGNTAADDEQHVETNEAVPVTEKEDDADGQRSKTRAATNRDAAHIATASDAELRSTVRFYTPYPASTDTVVHVVPVCAPLSVVASYPYHVELCFAAGAKKGQVAGQIDAAFKSRAAGERAPGDRPGARPRVVEAKERSQTRHAMGSSTSTIGTTATTAATAMSTGSNVGTWSLEATKNAAVLRAVEMMDNGEVVEQVRGSAAVLSVAKSRK